MIFKNKHFPFWLLTASIFILLVVSVLIQDGMFLDGLVNSSIARNLAEGTGSFWAIEYLKTFRNPFYDQLPLAIGIQSVFFKFFGDHLFVERIYSLLTAIITGCFIIKIWKTVYRNNIELNEYSWLPILYWIITPVVFWSYSNNMLENTMAIFDLLAVFLIIKAFETNSRIILHHIFAGIIITAAFLSKGPVGLFPIVTPLIYWLTFKNISSKNAIKYFFIVLLSSLITMCLFLIIQPDSLVFLSNYMNQQVINGVQGNRESVSNRFYIVVRLFSELLPMLILIALVFVFGKNKVADLKSQTQTNKFISLFLIIGLSASLPIAISHKQSGYYLIPAFPYFVLAAGIFSVKFINQLFAQFNLTGKVYKSIRLASIIVFLLAMTYTITKVGKTGRDEKVLKDIYLIGNTIPVNSMITVCPDMFYDWGLHAYLMRYYKISLDPETEHPYYIKNKECTNEMINNYSKLEINTNIYEVYKHK